MVVLFVQVLSWLQRVIAPVQTPSPARTELVLDTAGSLQQWTQTPKSLTSSHPRALNPLPEPALG
jgi:hypothetical protein